LNSEIPIIWWWFHSMKEEMRSCESTAVLSSDAHLVVIIRVYGNSRLATAETTEEDENFQTTSIDSNTGQWHLVCWKLYTHICVPTYRVVTHRFAIFIDIFLCYYHLSPLCTNTIHTRSQEIIFHILHMLQVTIIIINENNDDDNNGDI
jgi:hypothetical protein